MKKAIFITLSIIFLAACAGNDEFNANENSTKTSEIASATLENLKEFEEKPILEEELNLESHLIQIVENNPRKRVVLLENEHGENIYKSIFIKNTGRLKIIQFDKGILYNGII